MTVTGEEELAALQAIGKICANVMQSMIQAAQPGMTTLELDALGALLLEEAGALSAPRVTYDFPGATCISVNEEVAHGIPGPRVLQRGDLINIDVSASKGGFFADTGASFQLKSTDPEIDRLCRDGRKAMEIGIAEVASGKPLGDIGKAIGRFAQNRGYSLIRNLASHGVGRSLHEYPEEVATWPNRDRRRITKGMVLTVEPFLSQGGTWANQGDDGWTLYSSPPALTVQYEHTVVATETGCIIVTLPG
ncbi:type I methionyl aminopeptidase [Xinfangfangia sp. CPCC 101601]|uniref:Methionine aminopeptidase n=1 Tax=Pseudogemmobacter lacusdianii TaxID=3069608 RepID=A0ABU0VZL8_9RHOB|nr:type I methionyl aminopeptidase [Xinfangfangia sp. CPCC 101601]MDQ2066640.1 type I methionyl aminopeptidase [Xinfangfangia sp. CPCC 101601]